MKRKIIKIDEAKCNGCGLCVPDCPEGALQVIDGKARLVGELLCDGLGACIGRCPQDAITIEERDAQDYDEDKVMANIVKAGDKAIAAHLKHLKSHGQKEYLKQAQAYLKKRNIDIAVKDEKLPCGCPGTAVKDFRSSSISKTVESEGLLSSQLQQWPIQLKLVPAFAPYLKDADLVIAADCVPFAYADFHRRFLKGKILLIFCPKLDSELNAYVEKLSEIFKQNNIRSITLVHMEVPCCFGLNNIVETALQQSGKSTIIKEYTISVKGEII